MSDAGAQGHRLEPRARRCASSSGACRRRRGATTTRRPGTTREAAHEHKKELVGRFLDEAGGRSVWDLGGNVGVFSRDGGASAGASVVCFDIDPGCVEVNYRKVKRGRRDERPAAALRPAQPESRPSAGRTASARRSRERGPADVAMALALIHHLAIGNNVPLDMVAEFFAELGNKLIIEFVPKSDPMVQTLLANREDIFPDYDQAGFERGVRRVLRDRAQRARQGHRPGDVPPPQEVAQMRRVPLTRCSSRRSPSCSCSSQNAERVRLGKVTGPLLVVLACDRPSSRSSGRSSCAIVRRGALVGSGFAILSLSYGHVYNAVQDKAILGAGRRPRHVPAAAVGAARRRRAPVRVARESRSPRSRRS